MSPILFAACVPESPIIWIAILLFAVVVGSLAALSGAVSSVITAITSVLPFVGLAAMVGAIVFSVVAAFRVILPTHLSSDKEQ